MLLLTSTHYNSAPPASSGHPVDSFDLSSPPQLLPLLLLRGGSALIGPAPNRLMRGSSALIGPAPYRLWSCSSPRPGGAALCSLVELFLSRRSCIQMLPFAFAPSPSFPVKAVGLQFLLRLRHRFWFL
jgi:hypothetical protein